ncbi:MAG: hypothetical protein GWN29_06200, partial [Gammaproteobacteria bacterium]|nr:hypothetical protein [Gammaproteobacteria bacterium]
RMTVGSWAYGILFGALVVILRMADPARPEATVSALLLASLCVPLIDHMAHSTRLGANASQDVGHE